MNEVQAGATTSTERRNVRVREALEYLAREPEGTASGADVLAHVASALPPTPDEVVLNRSGIPRWQTAFLFQTSSPVKAGWLEKDGRGSWRITDAGRQALHGNADPKAFNDVSDELYWEWMRRNRPRAWLIRGSSVGGHNLVPAWLEQGLISLPATYLTALPDPYDKAELKAAVDEGYAGRTSSYRRSMVTTYDRFLGQMSDGHLVLTTSEGMVHAGRVSGNPELVDDGNLPMRLRRAVEWATPDPGIPFAELPEPLPKRLAIGGDVVDLSDDLDVIQAWLDGLEQPPREVVTARPVLERPLVLGPLRVADERLAAGLHLTVDWLDRAIRLLDRRKQVILYGPPGTGKTYIAQALAEHLTDEGNVALVQFHPSYAYEDFVMGYRPVTDPVGAVEPGASAGAVRFALKDGPLMRIAEQARDNKAVPYVLIIDEINRANLAKVFGELYFLLEYRDRAINLLYSEEDSEDFYLPENLFLIGTMNTADRSIAVVDAAMRRRFAFLELHPSLPPVDGVLRSWLAANDHPPEAADLLDALNSRVKDKDFRIGPSYFMKPWIYEDSDGLDTVWATDLLPLLEEHHAGDGTDVLARYGLGAVRAAAARSLAPAPAPAPPSTGGTAVDGSRVLISPSHVGHLAGCPHPGSDPDLTNWGKVEEEWAWAALLAGQGLTATSGAVLGLTADRACQDCVIRWNARTTKD